MEPNPEYKRQANYQIVAYGALDNKWSDWFSGLEIISDEHIDGSPITIFTGTISDQAALRGILYRIWDLNMTIILVKREGEPFEWEGEEQ